MSAATAGGDVVLDEVDARALTEKMLVVDNSGWARDGDELYLVVGESGRTYRVDARGGRCSCPDQFYRGRECKHVRRVHYATREREIPDWVNTARVDDLLGAALSGSGRA